VIRQDAGNEKGTAAVKEDTIKYTYSFTTAVIIILGLVILGINFYWLYRRSG
jgi:hypothetical protein